MSNRPPQNKRVSDSPPHFFFPFDLLLGAGAELVEATLEARDEEPELTLLLLLTLSSALFYQS